MNPKNTANPNLSFFKWIEKIPISRLRVFHQLLIIILIMVLFFIIQGVTGIYVNDTMQRSSYNITRISNNRFNSITIVKTYIELVEKEYLKALTNRGNIKFLINELDIQGLPRIDTEMIPAVKALSDIAPVESRNILAHIARVQKLIRLPVGERNYAVLKKELASLSISIDAANNKSINASFDTITESSNFAATSKTIMVMISIVAIAILSIIYIFMLSRTITEPIRKLTAYSMEIAKGNFQTEKLYINSSDELNILAFAFNKMAASIQNMITEITEKSNLERKLHEEELKNLKISQQLNEARFLALQSQINPHFLFNTLNAIMRKSMFEKAPDTTRLIQSLSDIFRYNLQNYQKEAFLEEELAIVKDYIHIQKARFGSRIGFDIVSRDFIAVPAGPERSSPGGMPIPRFIIQPLVENAIIHGIEPKESGGSVRIKIYRRPATVIVKIIDNGVGIPPQQVAALVAGSDEIAVKAHTTGIGINNVRDRMILYYKDAACFQLRSKLGFGTVITLQLNYNRLNPIVQKITSQITGDNNV